MSVLACVTFLLCRSESEREHAPSSASEVRRKNGKKCKTHRNGQVITTSQLGNLANVSEGSTHDNSLVSVLLVVIENFLNGLDSWVLLALVVLSGLSLVPIEDTTNEWRDEEGTGLGGGDGLDLREEKGEVAVDAMLFLKDARGLDTFPGGGDLDEDAVLGDAFGLVELFIESSARCSLDGYQSSRQYGFNTHLENVQRLVNSSLCIERKSCIDLGRNLARHNL